eukprot:5985574-Pyramimonas_sp.AAC.1
MNGCMDECMNECAHPVGTQCSAAMPVKRRPRRRLSGIAHSNCHRKTTGGVPSPESPSLLVTAPSMSPSTPSAVVTYTHTKGDAHRKAQVTRALTVTAPSASPFVARPGGVILRGGVILLLHVTGPPVPITAR